MLAFLRHRRRRRALRVGAAMLAMTTRLAIVGASASYAAATDDNASPCVAYRLPALPGDGHGELITMNSAGIYIGGVRDGSGAHAAWWTHAGSDLSAGWSLHVPDIPGTRTEFID